MKFGVSGIGLRFEVSGLIEHTEHSEALLESRVEAHGEGHAAMVWAALLRMLDRRDSSYRE